MRKTTHLTLCLILSLLALASCAMNPPQQPEATIVTEAGQPELYLWPNRNSHSNDEATVHLLVRAGSLQERDDERGFAHFVEHMAFNGTEAFPGSALQARLRELGMELGPHSNAYTTFDHTLYTIHLNTVSEERLDAALELLGQWAYHIEFDPAEVEQERDIIVEEWRQSQPAAGRVSEQLEKAYYGGSRHLNRFPIGTRESIESASGDSLQAFYQRWYHAGNMAVIIAGDVDTRVVQDAFDRYFPAQPTHSLHQIPENHPLDPSAIPNFMTATDAFVGTGYLDLTYFTDVTPMESEQDLIDILAMEAVLDIWHQRANAQLVSSAGAINWVDYEWDFFETDRLLVRLSAGVNRGAFEAGFKVLEQERLTLIAQGVTESELNDWRDGVLSHERSQQDSASHLADEALDHALSGWPMVGQQRWIALIEEALPQLSSTDLQTALTRVSAVTPKIRIIHPQSIQPPQAQVVEAWLAAAATDLTELSRASTTEDESWPINPEHSGRITERVEHDNGVYEWQLSNGIQVLYRYSDQSPGKVYYDLAGLSGFNALDEEQTLAARMALPTLGASGLRHLDGPQLDQWLTSQGLEQRPYFNYFQRGMVGAGPSDDFPLMMRLLHIGLTEGRVNADTWAHIQTQNHAQLEALAAHPHKAWNDRVHEVLFRQDPAFRTMTPEELSAITAEQMQSLYQRAYAGAQNYRLAIAGDIDRRLVEQSLLTSIATLPAKEDTQDACPCRSYPSPSTDAAHRVSGSGEQQALVVLRYAVDKPEQSQGNQYDLHYLRLWLQQALHDEIRETQGRVYALSVELDGFLVFQDQYTLVVSANTDPAQVDALVAEIEATLRTLSENPPTRAAIAQWQRTLADEGTQRLNNAQQQADALANLPLLGRTVSTALLTADERDTPTPAALSDQLTRFMADSAIRLELAWLP
ncbi:MAG: M16 family metallopeptidase [Saccharospirillum sp.]